MMDGTHAYLVPIHFAHKCTAVQSDACDAAAWAVKTCVLQKGQLHVWHAPQPSLEHNNPDTAHCTCLGWRNLGGICAIPSFPLANGTIKQLNSDHSPPES
jgi:hypothetical protein